MTAAVPQDDLLARLGDPDAEVRQAAATQLEQRLGGYGWRDGLRVLAATSAAPLPLAGAWEHTRVFLVHLLGRNPSQRWLEPIAARYADWDEATRAAGLAVVANEGSRAAAERFVALLQRFGWPQRPKVALAQGFLRRCRHAEVLFPAVLEVPVDLERMLPLLELVEAYAARGAVDLRSLPAAQALVRLAAQARAALPALAPGHDPTARFAPGYARPRLEYRWLLSLCTRIGGDAALAELRAATDGADPRLVVTGVLGLLANDAPVRDADLQRCAADDETRALLWRGLRGLGREQRFPAAAAGEPDLARSELVQWLAQPDTLARVPAAIEVVRALEVPHRQGAERARFHLLRFRATPDGPWKAGIAGPYGGGGDPGLEGAMTGSVLADYDEQSDEGHLALIVRALHRVARERTA
jgi:hypothetical protein